MGNSATKHENRYVSSKAAVNATLIGEGVQGIVNRGSTQERQQTKAAECIEQQQHSKESAASQEAEVSAEQQQQRWRQQSTWSLGSLSGRLNWSFTGAIKNSFRNRNKSTRKSCTHLQHRRAKTVWHRPLTNAIFSTHFKDNSRNEQFHIDCLIAKGAFGVVFRVIDKQASASASHAHLPESDAQDQPPTAHVFALKVLKKSKVIAENSVQQIKDEADIQKLCGHHPFVVQQFDLWQNRHNLHILCEYLPNGELFAKIATFSLDLVRVYVAEIALALDFLHNAGVIYRDAKPENILLTANFHLKLTDFGLSKWLKLGSNTRTMCGTFQYMGTLSQLN